MSYSNNQQPSPPNLVRQLGLFFWRVIRHFLDNHGILLAGGVGYNVLLSAVPMLALLTVLLTHVVDEALLLETIAIQTQHFAPTHANLLLDAAQTFVDSRDLIGIIGLPLMLFFSSFAFRMLEESLAIIFHRPNTPQRNFWISALLPYAFILILGAGLLALTVIFSLINAFYEAPSVLLYFISFIGVFMLFSAIYKLLPIVHVSTKRAIVGGLVAAILWEATRLLLMYYFINISFVNVVYGSLATIIVILISLEVSSIILLLGAQVIAELEHSERQGLAWYQSA